MEDLGSGEVEFELAGEFLLELKKEFGGGDEKSVKVTKLKKNKVRRKNNKRVHSRI